MLPPLVVVGAIITSVLSKDTALLVWKDTAMLESKIKNWKQKEYSCACVTGTAMVLSRGIINGHICRQSAVVMAKVIWMRRESWGVTEPWASYKWQAWIASQKTLLTVSVHLWWYLFTKTCGRESWLLLLHHSLKNPSKQSCKFILTHWTFVADGRLCRNKTFLHSKCTCSSLD